MIKFAFLFEEYVMKNLLFGIVVCAFLFSGCTTKISDKVPDNGIMKYDEVTFPEMSKAWRDEGIYPNSENLRKLKPGLNKDEVAALIGWPHFREGMFGVVEWDYIFKFPRANAEDEICQFKIVFDKDKLARSFFYKPQDCNSSNKNIVMNSEAVLFDIGSAKVKSINENIINQLVQNLQDNPELSVVVEGHTDITGSAIKNITLSQNRAIAVAHLLISKGINKSRIIVKAYGQIMPIASNSTAEGRQANRRVEAKFTK